MIRLAALYLAHADDQTAALSAVGGRPLAFRTLMAAVRAGVHWVGVPEIFRGTEVERAIDGTPSARRAVVWLDAAAAPPEDPLLLLRAAALVMPSAVAQLARRGATRLGEERCPSDAPVLLVGPELVRLLWPTIVSGRPAGVALGGAAELAEVSAPPGRSVPAHAAGAGSEAEALLYASLGSPIDSRLDALLHRRLSRPITRLAVSWGVTPNQLTLASLAVGLLAVWALGRGEPWPGAVGLLLYALSVVLDHADGEVARLTLAESTVGEWLDIVADTVVHALLVVAMGVATERLVGGGGVVLGVAGAAGVVAGAALAKAWPPEAETDGLGAMFRCLTNRNGFYVLLLLFIAALALLPAALPVVMLVAAAGMHAYWLGRVLHRLAHPGSRVTHPSSEDEAQVGRGASGRAHGEGELGLDDVTVDGEDAEPDDVGARRERR